MLRPRPGRRSAVFSGISAAALTTLTVVGLAALPTAQASAYASPGAPSRALSPATTATHQINAGAVARNSDGRLEIFAIGSDSAVWQDTQSAANASTWNGWTSLGGGVNATPVAGQESDGRLAVFDTNSAGTVFQDVQTTAGASTWSGWAGLGGDMVASSLSVVKTSDGKLNLFAINASNLSVQVNTQTTAGGGWGGWTSLGIPGTGVQPQFAELTAIQNTDGRLEAFAISGLTTYVDEQLTAGGSWGGWSAFSTGNETHSVSVAKNLDGRLEILAWDKVSSTAGSALDNAQLTPDGNWTGWTTLPTVTPTGPPIVASNKDGRLEAFVTATDGNLYRDYQNGSPGGPWIGWTLLGKPTGTLADSPAVFNDADGRLQVFITTTAGVVWTNWQMTPGSGYGTWVSLG